MNSKEKLFQNRKESSLGILTRKVTGDNLVTTTALTYQDLIKNFVDYAYLTFPPNPRLAEMFAWPELAWQQLSIGEDDQSKCTVFLGFQRTDNNTSPLNAQSSICIDREICGNGTTMSHIGVAGLTYDSLDQPRILACRYSPHHFHCIHANISIFYDELHSTVDLDILHQSIRDFPTSFEPKYFYRTSGFVSPHISKQVFTPDESGIALGLSDLTDGGNHLDFDDAHFGYKISKGSGFELRNVDKDHQINYYGAESWSLAFPRMLVR